MHAPTAEGTALQLRFAPPTISPVSFPATPSDDQPFSRRPGITPPTKSVSGYSFLSDALVARGLISQEAMDRALSAARDGRRYAEILVSDGLIDEDAFARATADHHAVDHVDLDAFALEPEARALVAPEVARRNGALPIARLRTGEVIVAIHDPGLTNLIEIADLTKSPIRAVIGSRTQIERHIGGTASPALTGPLVTPPPFAPRPTVALVPPAPAAAAALEVAIAERPPPAPDPTVELTARMERAERAERAAADRALEAERRADGMVAAAQAANDALAQLAHARAAADDVAAERSREIESLRGEVEGLRAELAAERSARRRTEGHSPPLPQPLPPAPAPVRRRRCRPRRRSTRRRCRPHRR